MRMLTISAVFLLVLILIWIWFHFTSIEIITSYYWESLAELSNFINNDDWSRAERDMQLYSNKWEETRKLWVYFINQRDIDEIDASMKKLHVYIRNFNKDMAQAEIEQLRLYFNVIKENECLSLDNIF